MASTTTRSDPRLHLLALVARRATHERNGRVVLPCNALGDGVEDGSRIVPELDRMTAELGRKWRIIGYDVHRDEFTIAWRSSRA